MNADIDADIHIHHNNRMLNYNNRGARIVTMDLQLTYSSSCCNAEQDPSEIVRRV